MENFNFFMPINISKGGKTEDGKEKMIIQGIASTMEEDSDGEILDPKGFDLSHFMKYGFLNYNHLSKSNPLAIIGEPVESRVEKDKLYVKGELYQDSAIAKGVYKLAKTLSKNSKGRRLGFSVEGKVIERDPYNEKLVKKAIITGLAVTPSPKNYNSLLDIVKGNCDEMFCKYEFEKSDNYIIDEIVDGERITIDENLNVEMKKTEVETEDMLKAILIISEGYEKNLVSEKEFDCVREKMSE